MIIEGLLSLVTHPWTIFTYFPVSLVDIESAFAIVSSATSIVASLIIAYRISSFTMNEDKVRQKYMHIAEIIMQSVAVYSIAVLVLGISGCIPQKDSNEANQVAVDMMDYMTTLTALIAVCYLYY